MLIALLYLKLGHMSTLILLVKQVACFITSYIYNKKIHGIIILIEGKYILNINENAIE